MIKHLGMKEGLIMSKKHKYYAVKCGRKPGIYESWEDTLKQVDKYPGAQYKSFIKQEDALKYYRNPNHWKETNNTDDAQLVIYTDGGERSSQKLGAYAFYTVNKIKNQSYCAKRAVPNVTNQQMELMALLSALKHNYEYVNNRITIVTDSKYLMHTFTNNWIENWRKNDWRKSDNKPVKNLKLMQSLYEVINHFHHVNFRWVKGHANNAGNNRVDLLVNQAMDEYLKDRRI